MTRLEASRLVAATLTDEAVVASLGHPAYDLFASGDRPLNFYTWGSMGLACPIGLGLAMAQPQRRIIVLDGDGSLLMNLGALATITAAGPPKLTVIVWDNGSYGTTGGQPSPTAMGVDLAEAALGLGVASAIEVATPDRLAEALSRTGGTDGPHVIVVKVTESAPIAKPPLDCVYLKQRFMAAMDVPEAATLGGPS
jgi:thiamine pyrophosphate-dependent acetolactate synthase large subunit-like protein